jgi:single-strand DNA-binding protein
MINVVVLEGVLARPAQDVELPSGSRLLSLEVSVKRDTGPAEPVPVAWFDPPAWATTLDAGAAVVVVGRVRRRFFRAGGATQSRTEVVASRIARASASSRVKTMLEDAIAAIDPEARTARTARTVGSPSG